MKTTLLILLCSTLTLLARPGETEKELLARYGPPESRRTNGLAVSWYWSRPTSANICTIWKGRCIMETVFPPRGQTFSTADEKAVAERLCQTNLVWRPDASLFSGGDWESKGGRFLVTRGPNAVSVCDAKPYDDLCRAEREKLVKGL